MINRSTLKYKLKKILPSSIFNIVLFVWSKVLLHMVEAVDLLRLKKFTKRSLVHVEHNGMKFSLYITPLNGFIDNYIFLYGVYESFMLDVITEHLRPGMTFIDIGANIGQHSMYAASLVGKEGSVYSFEPIPRVYQQLKDSSLANHFESIITAKNCALGNENKKETLYVSQKNIGSSSLVVEDKTHEVLTVTIVRGDDELLPLPSIDMIKIDVEGYEYEVLEGIEKTLQKHHPVIVVEFSGDIYKKESKDHGKKILSLLKKNGYTLYDIEDDMKEIQDQTLFLSYFVTTRKQTNLLCIAHTPHEI